MDGSTRAAGLTLVLAAVLAGCGAVGSPSPEPVAASPDAHGLVVLDGGRLHGFLGDPQKPASVEIPVASGTSWIASSIDGRLVGLSGNAAISVSDKLSANSSSPQPNWKVLDITDAGSHVVSGPYGFPSWDPQGTRLALLAFPVDGEPQLVIADAATGKVAIAVPLEGPDRPIRMAWGGPDRVALIMAADTVGEPDWRGIIVDATTGAITDGPSRLAWAASPDASLVLTNDGARPGNGPYAVQKAALWPAGGVSLAGNDAVLGVLAEPSSAGGYQAFAFDQAGQRVAFSFGDNDTVAEHIFTGSTGWKEGAMTPARDRADPISIAWLP